VFNLDIRTIEQIDSVEHQVVVPRSDFGKTNRFPSSAALLSLNARHKGQLENLTVVS
jgi:hypothetical protein